MLSKIGIVLVVLSFILYGLIAVVPFLPITTPQKAIAVTTLIVSGEITWWVGVAIVGKQAITKYKKYLNPCTWGSCLKNTLGNSK